MIKFFMPMVPPTITAQEHKVMKRNGRVVFYDPPELKEARQKLLSNLAIHVPSKRFEGPLSLNVMWLFPLTKNKNHGDYKTTKPDTDNLEKMLKDCMTKCGFWKDDALVCVEHVEKRYGDIMGILIEIKELDETEDEIL